MFGSKKGALELSITAIVVLIIAITVLGFAIFFVKDLFGKGSGIIEEQFSSIEQKLREELATSGETLALNIGTEIEAKRGQRKRFYVGISNSGGNDACFALRAICETPFNQDNNCDGKSEGVVAGGQAAELKWFPTFPPSKLIKRNDVYVAPLDLQITTANRDTYRVNLQLFTAENCDNIDYDTENINKFVESKQLHIQVI